MNSSVAIAAVESAARPTRVRFAVLAAFCLAAVLAYVHRTSIGVVEESIRNDAGLSLPQMGWVMSGFFWAYALSQIPSGWLGSRWGTRRALTAYVILFSVLVGLLAQSSGFPMVLIVWMAVGAAQAGLFPCCANSVSKWFPSTQRALPSGFLGASMSVGGAIATALTGWLLLSFDWRVILLFYAVPGLLWSVLFYWWFRDRPEEHRNVNALELAFIRGEAVEAAGERDRPATVMPPHPRPLSPGERGAGAAAPLRTPWADILLSRRMQLICLQQFFRAAGFVFYATWFPTYLKETRGVTTEAAGYLTSLPLVAVVLGGLLGGPLADWIQVRTGSRRLSRQLLGVLSQFLCGSLVLTAYFIRDPVLAVAVISLGSFAFAFGSCCAYTVTIDMAGEHVATVFSTMNMCGNFGAAACPVIVGWLVRETGWEPILLFFSGLYFAAAVCWAFLNPEGTIFDELAR